MRLPRSFAAVAALAISSVVLVGCDSAEDPEPEPGPVETSAAAPTPEPEPTFVPGGGAEENKAFFDLTLETLLDENPEADSHDLVNTLVDAGFDKSQMEVTFDRTTVDFEADFLIVSVKMPDDMCLLGQSGTRGYSSIVAEPMSTGKCQIGVTQTIDW